MISNEILKKHTMFTAHPHHAEQVRHHQINPQAIHDLSFPTDNPQQDILPYMSVFLPQLSHHRQREHIVELCIPASSWYEKLLQVRSNRHMNSKDVIMC